MTKLDDIEARLKSHYASYGVLSPPSLGDIAYLLAEVKRLTPYVEAFRREEVRADKMGGEVDDLTALALSLAEALERHCSCQPLDDGTHHESCACHLERVILSDPRLAKIRGK